MSEGHAKRGRPHKLNPHVIAGWRYAKEASIAETAKHFKVSLDTVKRACRDHGEGALQARQSYFSNQWDLQTDRQLEAFESGNFRAAESYEESIWRIEAGLRETERAMAKRGVAYVPAMPETATPSSEQRQQEVERARRRKIFG